MYLSALIKITRDLCRGEDEYELMGNGGGATTC